LCVSSGASQVINTIIRGNTAPIGPDVSLSSGATATFSWCDAPFSAFDVPTDAVLVNGPGNIETDPLFADPANGDYHLKSRFGRWFPDANAGAGGWISDDVTSPCIDAGDPESSYASETLPNFARINIGAYGNTSEASKSGWNIPGDANADCRVNILDLIVVRNRLALDVNTADNWVADVNADGRINILDLIYIRGRMGSDCH